MKIKDDQNGGRRRFDTAYINPCIDRVLEAIEWQKKGSKVLLVFENPLNRTDNFQITETFPLNIFQIPKTIHAQKFWHQLFKRCPYLVQSQNVIYANSPKSIVLSKLNSLLYKDQIVARSKQIAENSSDKFRLLTAKNTKGLIFKEYKINVSRLFIAILKHFELKGGKVLLKAFRPEEVTTIIQCNSNTKQRLVIPVKVPENFVMVQSFQKSVFRFVQKNQVLQIDTLNKYANRLSNSGIVSVLQKMIDFDSKEAYEVKIDSHLSIYTIKNILNTIPELLPGAFPGTQLKDNYELSLEKFDIAKQTGITYPNFKILFHRYGNTIDEMIDSAYAKMNKMRDPIKIWETVETEYQSTNEWKN